MAKVILNDGSEEFLSPGAARRKAAAGEGVLAEGIPTYSTRQMTAEKPRQMTAEPIPAPEAKPKRKRRTKAEMEEQAESDEAE